MEAQQKTSSLNREAKLALWGGILFSLVFTMLIGWAGQWLDESNFVPDQGASWYFWKLPNPTFWTRFTAWSFYVAHQLVTWGLIYYAQTRVKSYTKGLHKVNWIALGANAFFIILHFIQTHIWYDGLAQDVSVWSSQGSVILMLVMVLLMENRRRGLFWGKKAPISKSASDFVRKYHGYVFGWAIVYTFWYHPMTSSTAHLGGFFYMFLLMLQGSMFYTRLHTNKWWMLVQEATVLIHGTMVAIMQGNGMWPMFFFGFGGLFVLTQMHGVPLPKWAKWSILGAYVAGALVNYGLTDITMIHQVTWIPIIEYLGVFILSIIIGGGIKLVQMVQKANVNKAKGALA